MKLDAGFYKVSKGDKLNRSYHLLRVWYEGRKKYIQLDHSFPQEVSEDDEKDFILDHQLVEVYNRRKHLEISKPMITVEFEERGTPIYLRGRNLLVLRRMLDQFPKLYRVLGGK